MYRIFVNKTDKPEYYVRVITVTDLAFGIGFVEAGNDFASSLGKADHYILAEIDEDIDQIPANDIWGNSKVKILHPDEMQS